tara:strand:+ start:28 stop:480 length:453 start_codon:yes stop_codon:yes gene_type:complete
MQGFIVNDAEVTGITGSYVLGKKVLLHEDNDPSTGSDVYSKAMPNSCYLSHLDLQLDQEEATLHKYVSCFLTWDAAGDDPMTSESAGNQVVAGLTDTSLALASIALDVWVTRPAGQTTAGKVYLHLRGNAAGATYAVKKARLHWATRKTI